MKFKDPKTGEVFEIGMAFYRFCANQMHKCGKGCKIFDKAVQYNRCIEYVSENEEEAACLMGYELVDDHLPDPTKKVDAQENPLQYIFDTFGRDEILAQAAEEATELAQALLKLRRSYRGTTPVSVQDALEKVNEEHNDLTLCMDVLLSRNDEPIGDTGVIRCKKLERWVERAKEYEKRIDRAETP